MQKLVISPQAGLGNRLRALCSCAVFGSLIGREVLHYWVPDPIKGPAEHVNEVKGLEPQDVFDLGIKKFEGDGVDVCYTEWLPGEYWYETQSTAQRSLQCGEKRRLASSHEIAGCEAETVLIETSLEFELGSAQKYRVPLMANTYHTLFKLNERWNKLYETLPVFDCAVSVRRGDFLSYFPEADIPVRAVAERINKIDGTKIIFSDDIAYQAELRRLTYSFVGVSDMALMDEHLVTFFVISKAKRVIGTKGSSFPEQAAIFGGKEPEFI